MLLVETKLRGWLVNLKERQSQGEAAETEVLMERESVREREQPTNWNG